MNTDELRVLRAVAELGEGATEPAVWVRVNKSLLEGGEMSGARVALLLDWLRATNHLGNRITTTAQGLGEYTISKYFLTVLGAQWLRTGVEPPEDEDDYPSDGPLYANDTEDDRCPQCHCIQGSEATHCIHCGHVE